MSAPDPRAILRDPARWGRPPSCKARRRAQALSRRSFLRGVGGVTVGLPLLSSLSPRRARAQEQSYPKRLVIMIHPNGVIPEAWFPTAGANEQDFTLATCHEPLAAFQDKLVVTSGINMPSVAGGPGEPHQSGMGGVLTGWPLLSPSNETGSFVGGDGSVAGWGSSISVDQRVAQEIGGGTKLASLQLGVRCTTSEVRSRISYLGPAWPLPPINDPQQTWASLFADFTAEEGTLARLQAQRKSVLDTVMGQLDLLRPQLSGIDRQRLEAHGDMVRDLEQRLDGEVLEGASCHLPSEPPPFDWDHEMNMPLATQLQMDMLSMALTCDLTRVVTLQFSNAQNHIRMPWVDKTPHDDEFEASMGDGHSLSHAGPSATAQNNESIARDTWYAEQFAYLLGKLDQVPEGEGTLLDNTLVLWVNELAVGNTHSHNNMPFVLAGGLGGAIETGRYLQFPGGASHNQLLLSVLQGFGIASDSFGDPAFCPEPLPGLLVG